MSLHTIHITLIGNEYVSIPEQQNLKHLHHIHPYFYWTGSDLRKVHVQFKHPVLRGLNSFGMESLKIELFLQFYSLFLVHACLCKRLEWYLWY